MTGSPDIPFNRPWFAGDELEYVAEAVAAAHISAGGVFSERCTAWLEAQHGSARALLTPSGTHALELAALLLEAGPGDEVVMPSFTFPSTANAFVLRGAEPVFVDVREDTLNLDPARAADALTDRTVAIVPVHYAAVAADMQALGELARDAGVALVEDAAHALPSSWRGRQLGGIGDLGVLSFHETKNVTCGEGGALLVNHPRWVERAEVLQNKGTDRARFMRGEVDRYRWQDVGSSLGASDLAAAFLWAQLQTLESVTARRLKVWHTYHEAFAAAEEQGLVRRPTVPEDCEHNGHIYYLLLADPAWRPAFLDALARRGVQAVFHYAPLHDSPAGRRFARAHGSLDVTVRASAALVRLPMWAGLGAAEAERVVAAVYEGLEAVSGANGRKASAVSATTSST